MNDIYTDFAPDCDVVSPLITALADDELSDHDAAHVRAHLETCQTCRAMCVANARVRVAARAWTMNAATERRDLWAGVRARIAAEEKAETPPPAKRTLASSFMSAAQMAHAQYVSKTRGLPVNEILLDLGYATERDLAEAWALSENIPFVDLTRHKPQASALEALPAAVALAADALPVMKDGNRLWAVFRNPRDTNALDAVRVASRCMVQPMHAAPSEFEQAMAEAYPSTPPLAQASPLAPPPAPATDDATTNAALAAIQELRAELAALQTETASLRREVARLKAQAAPASLPQARFDLYSPSSASALLDVPARVH